MKAYFHLRQNSIRNVLSHNPGLSITALIRFIPRRLFSNIFPSFGEIALMVFQDNSHVDNGQGSSGGGFDYAYRKLRLRKSNP